MGIWVVATVVVVVQRPFTELVAVTNILMVAQEDQGAFLVMVENTLKLVGSLLQVLGPLSLKEF